MKIALPVKKEAGRTIVDAEGNVIFSCRFDSGPGKPLSHVEADQMTDLIVQALNERLPGTNKEK